MRKCDFCFQWVHSDCCIEMRPARLHHAEVNLCFECLLKNMLSRVPRSDIKVESEKREPTPSLESLAVRVRALEKVICQR